MAINFPASPSTNDTHTENAITWIFNGTSWDAQGDQVTAASIGLGDVDNTADTDKPISTATQTALDDKADDADLTSHTGNISNPHRVKAADVGVYVEMGTASATASANVATFATKLAEAKSANLPLYFNEGETYNIDSALDIEGSGLTLIFGAGASINQTTASAHGFRLNESTPPHDLKIYNATITGAGHATSTGAGVYGRRSNDGYLLSDIQLINGEISGFQEGLHLRNVVKLYTQNLDILNNVTGYYMDKVDTYLIENARVTGSSAGGAISDSRCFYFGEQTFGGKVLMGEFGGSNIERFCEIDGIGVEAVFEGCNLEGFESQQVCTMESTGGNVFSFRHGRCTPRVGATDADSFLSIDASGNDSPFIEVNSVSDWSPTAYRMVEVVNSTVDPNVSGRSILVKHAATRGGSVTRSRMVYCGVKGWRVAQAALPNSSVQDGEQFFWDYASTASDEWLAAPVWKLYSTRASSSARYTTINEQHSQVIGASNSGNAGSGTVTMHTATLGKKMLSSNGERVEVNIGGKTAANTNNKQIQVKLNGYVMFDSGALALNGKHWDLKFVMQADSSYEKWRAVLTTDDSVVGTVMDEGDSNPVYGNSSSDLVFTVDAVCVGASDISYRCGHSMWRRTTPLINS